MIIFVLTAGSGVAAGRVDFPELFALRDAVATFSSERRLPKSPDCVVSSPPTMFNIPGNTVPQHRPSIPDSGDTAPGTSSRLPWLFGLGLAGALAALSRFTQLPLTGRPGNNKAELYQSLVENSSEAIVVIDASSKGIIEFNKAFAELTGYPAETIAAAPLCQFIAISPEGMDRIFQLASDGKQTFMGEVRCRRKDNSLLDTELRINALSLIGQKVYVATLHEINLRRQTERTMHEIASRFRLAIFCAPIPIMIHADDGKIIMTSNEWTNLSGYSFNDTPTLSIWTEKAFGTGSYEDHGKFYSLFSSGKPSVAGELEIRCRSGRKRIWDFRSAPIGSLPDSRQLFITMAVDITERNMTEEKLKESLAEKEVLLKEIHHRVKNNMQVISSLMNLQAQYTDKPEMHALFKESQARVRSMAMIHEMLYRSQHLGKVDLDEYTRNLISDIMRTYCMNPGCITVKSNVNSIKLGLETAIPCGLVIHELVSNSLKHGFPDARKGTIRLDISYEQDGQYLMLVSDDGVGFAESRLKNRTGSLGLSLVNILTRQLHGSIEHLDGPGTSFRITFRERPPGKENAHGQ
jgi:PAS domain S-box-containing protein